MNNTPYIFFATFTVCFWSTLILLRNHNTAGNKHLALKKEEVPIPQEVYAKEQPSSLAVTISSSDDRVSPTPIPTNTLSPSATPAPVITFTPTPMPIPTDTPEPTPTPDVWSPPDMEPIFSRFAGQYGVDKNILERLANCESHFNPEARNGDYVGMFQFSTHTWSDIRVQIGEDPNPDLRTNIDASIQTAAYLVSQRGTAPWPACLR